MLLNGFWSDRTQRRFLHIVGPLIITLVANIIAVSSLSIAARYVAIMLLPGSFYASAVVILSWITGSLNQPAPKRASAIALINAIWYVHCSPVTGCPTDTLLCSNTPNIWGSYLYGNAPRFLEAFIVNIAATGLAIGFATATFFYLRRVNAKLEQGKSVGKNGPTEAQLAAGFRYTL